MPWSLVQFIEVCRLMSQLCQSPRFSISRTSTSSTTLVGVNSRVIKRSCDSAYERVCRSACCSSLPHGVLVCGCTSTPSTTLVGVNSRVTKRSCDSAYERVCRSACCSSLPHGVLVVEVVDGVRSDAAEGVVVAVVVVGVDVGVPQRCRRGRCRRRRRRRCRCRCICRAQRGEGAGQIP